MSILVATKNQLQLSWDYAGHVTFTQPDYWWANLLTYLDLMNTHPPISFLLLPKTVRVCVQFVTPHSGARWVQYANHWLSITPPKIAWPNRAAVDTKLRCEWLWWPPVADGQRGRCSHVDSLLRWICHWIQRGHVWTDAAFPWKPGNLTFEMVLFALTIKLRIPEVSLSHIATPTSIEKLGTWKVWTKYHL